jgi:O-antigen/teichoic acid export membrane protein
MQRKFVTNLMFLLALNFLIKPFWILGIDRTIQNVVGAEDYGFYFTVFNFSLLFNIILDLGISTFNNRNIAQHQQLLKKHFSGIIFLRLLLMIVYGLILFIVGYTIGYDTKQFYFLMWVGINQALLSFILYLRSNISGLLLFKTDSLISVLDRFLMIVICGLLLRGNIFSIPFQIEWLIYAQTLAYLITLLIALFIVIKESGFQKLNWNGPFLMMIVRKSWPYAVLMFLMSVYTRVDPVLIERILPGSQGEYQSGVYAQAFRLFDAGNNIALLFAVILLPIFSRMIKSGDSVEKLVKLSFTLIFTAAVALAIGSFYYRDEIMNLLYYQHENESLQVFNKRILESANIFGVMMFSFVAVCGSYIFGTLLTALGDIKLMIKIALIGVVINLMVNILLIPQMEALGAAYANFSAHAITTLAMIIGVQYRFKFRINYQYLSQLAIYVFLVVGISYASKLLPIQPIFGFAVLLVISWFSAYILKLLNIRSFISILKSDPEKA